MEHPSLNWKTSALRWSRLLACGLACNAALATAEPDWKAQRAEFQAALRALQGGGALQAERLKNYPLYPYLLYTDLNARFGRGASDGELQAFLNAHPDGPFSERLRDAWLHALGQAGDWRTYMRVYRPGNGNAALQCYYVQALANTGGDAAQVRAAAKDLWLVGDSRPNQCDPVFDYLDRQGLIDKSWVWQRIHLAMDKGNTKLAGFLSKRLDQSDQAWVARWQAMYHGPARQLADFTLPDSDMTRTLLRTAYKRLAKDDAASAYRYWNAQRGKYAFTAQERGEILQALGLQGALQGIPQAHTWLAQLEPAYITEEVADAWLRLLLQNQDWKALLLAYSRLPEEIGGGPQWRYWHARALQQTGQAQAAHAAFRKLAEVRDYYGFLAANQAGSAYNMQHQPVKYTPAEATALSAKYPGILRAREFFALDMQREARREWAYLEARMEPRELAVAAALARSWGWFDRAIFSAAKAGVFDDLEIRFPLAFQSHLENGARQTGLDLAWVYGIVRQESAFMHDARSHVGALGLMQLMPATGKATAKRVGLKVDGVQDIIELENNVRLGTSYMRQMLDKFDGNYMLATAAYNAGPGRAVRWTEERGCLPADVWVELIPFQETRTYVRRVLEYTAVFEARLGHSAKPLRVAQARRDCAGSPTPVTVMAAAEAVTPTAQPAQPDVPVALAVPAQAEAASAPPAPAQTAKLETPGPSTSALLESEAEIVSAKAPAPAQTAKLETPKSAPGPSTSALLESEAEIVSAKPAPRPAAKAPAPIVSSPKPAPSKPAVAHAQPSKPKPQPAPARVLPKAQPEAEAQLAAGGEFKIAPMFTSTVR